MKIIDEKEIDEVSKQFGREVGEGSGSIDTANGALDGFQAGVAFAEEKVEDLCIEFADWIKSNDRDPSFNITTLVDRSIEDQREVPIWGTTRLGYGQTFTSKDLFNKFIKERNEKS